MVLRRLQPPTAGRASEPGVAVPGLVTVQPAAAEHTDVQTPATQDHRIGTERGNAVLVHDVGRQQREFEFLQQRAQAFAAVVEFMIAHQTDVVTQAIHHLGHRGAHDAVHLQRADGIAGHEIPGVEEYVRRRGFPLLRQMPGQGHHAAHETPVVPPRRRTRQEVAVAVVGMEERQVVGTGTGLRPDRLFGGGAHRERRGQQDTGQQDADCPSRPDSVFRDHPDPSHAISSGSPRGPFPAACFDIVARKSRSGKAEPRSRRNTWLRGRERGADFSHSRPVWLAFRIPGDIFSQIEPGCPSRRAPGVESLIKERDDGQIQDWLDAG